MYVCVHTYINIQALLVNEATKIYDFWFKLTSVFFSLKMTTDKNVIFSYRSFYLSKTVLFLDLNTKPRRATMEHQVAAGMGSGERDSPSARVQE